MFEASVIVTTYNRLDALRLALAGFRRQTNLGFEIIVADDGSAEATREFLAANATSHPFPLVHVWHEDTGYRKTEILNKALARARAGYVIFSDGDCIPHRKFIEEHLHWRAPGHFLVGRLAYLSEAYSRSIDEDDVLAGKLEGINVTLVRDALRGEGKALGHSFYIGNRLLLSVIHRLRAGRTRIMGGNFSAWRDDLFAVNGFNEGFATWGAEDDELHYRLCNLGRRARLVINRAITYHYYHDRSYVRHDEANLRRVREARSAGLVRCARGLDRHLQASTGV